MEEKLFQNQNVAFYKLRAGNDYQSVGQCHWLQDTDDLAASPALSLSLGRLHPWLLRRSISGTHRKAHGCSWEQSATVLLPAADPFISSSGLLPAGVLGSEFSAALLDQSFTTARSTQPLSQACCPATAPHGKMANWDVSPAKWQERFQGACSVDLKYPDHNFTAQAATEEA